MIDHWWQTETGWPIVGNPVGLGLLPVKHGSPTVPMPGYDVRVVDESAARSRAGQMGSIVVKLPLPPGCLPTLVAEGRALRAKATSRIFPAITRPPTPGSSTRTAISPCMGRTDDIINVAGHRLSTGGMEEVLASHPDVAECAVVGHQGRD